MRDGENWFFIKTPAIMFHPCMYPTSDTLWDNAVRMETSLLRFDGLFKYFVSWNVRSTSFYMSCSYLDVYVEFSCLRWWREVLKWRGLWGRGKERRGEVLRIEGGIVEEGSQSKWWLRRIVCIRKGWMWKIWVCWRWFQRIVFLRGNIWFGK